ncbi:peptidoglycan DD-metalloendopeptidase family protein [Flavobacterium sp. F339]|uniref:Peptidoglycan DD-metalloendopeptidase family protein n=2 Tax=Flavobacterium turcicum TaxID=2764718 RepID=A0ABR7JCY3_9FLAO|nr:peptidoglycan DD-metalloendopeptidase family protein [Flavobacterium turcicum]NHL00745.1 peptidoglycan DD-metalloendopeptidase family protein [Flavobacterium turcicum]
MPKLILSLICICMTSLLWSQESQQEKLEQRKEQIQKEIRENEKLLQSVKKKEKTVVNVIAIQSNKIKLKEKLINTTEKQTKLLKNDMYINQVQINKLKKELKILKEDYAKMIVKSYKSRSSESRAMFLLSSENFLQAYKRAQYMKQYTSYRKTQGEEIKTKTDKLADFNQKLDVQKTAKQKLIAENEKERLSLEKEKQEQLKLVNSIKKDKNKIAQEIKKRQQEYRTIDRQINRLIREAIAEANRKAALEKAKANPSAPVSKAAVSSSKIQLTPEAKLVADNFRANRGRLPYPVEKGFISLGYGNQTHPLFNTITIHNSGVEITTEKGASARAVFGGEVTSVMVISPVNKAVTILHGDYFTVYQNLSSVSVSKGDKVSIKQSIGKVRTNGDTGKTVLKFMISQNSTLINPEGWLSGR